MTENSLIRHGVYKLKDGPIVMVNERAFVRRLMIGECLGKHIDMSDEMEYIGTFLVEDDYSVCD